MTDGFYEIEYDTGSTPGTGKLVQNSKPQKIKEPEQDEVRALFVRMRDIARTHRATYDFAKFFERRVQNDETIIFHQQGLFMKDFTDDFTGNRPFSQYFPCYQMMGYEQLRTYFTWRTQIRQGTVTDISLSYAFLYLYELLGNIGVTGPQDGLSKLMFFWKAFRKHNQSIDKYVLRWLKDYHIYYELPFSFREFVEKNDLAGHYPQLAEKENSLDLFCAISKYNIKKSAFFTGETNQMISDCFAFVMDRIRRDFEAAGMNFDNTFFRPARKIVAWKPFKGALFYPRAEQPDRKIVLSENEIYMCKKNEWSFSTNITTEKGRRFISYVIKEMESTLRKITKYKFRLTADVDMIHTDTIRVLTKAGVYIEKIVPAAVLAYHKEVTKTVVTVDDEALARIRHEALVTQNALIVEEQALPVEVQALPEETDADSVRLAAPDQSMFADASEETVTMVSDMWENLKDVLNEEEVQALTVVLQGGDIKTFADTSGLMVEVLVDRINEKAMDYVGDNLMDEDFVLYDDYKEQVKELIK